MGDEEVWKRPSRSGGGRRENSNPLMPAMSAVVAAQTAAWLPAHRGTMVNWKEWACHRFGPWGRAGPGRRHRPTRWLGPSPRSRPRSPQQQGFRVSVASRKVPPLLASLAAPVEATGQEAGSPQPVGGPDVTHNLLSSPSLVTTCAERFSMASATEREVVEKLLGESNRGALQVIWLERRCKRRLAASSRCTGPPRSWDAASSAPASEAPAAISRRALSGSKGRQHAAQVMR